MVLTDGEVVESDLIGEDTLRHQVADRLAVRERSALGVVGHVAERVQPKRDRVPTRGGGGTF
ncbi:hypothetical protein [Streptomyces sp. OV198]|uniref:hypothetical protein n=1 Tax=Streptomyces sp. OV198 TaxID=1882787 RepID=UPI0027BA4A11|nr:hypothetical protein [Streptomyces sp. OV198]